jgi:hypothetical protein
MTKGKWYSIKICTTCKSKLTESQRTQSGICPYCVNDSMTNICDTENVLLRKVNKSPWWKFFKRKIKYEGRNAFSKDWLDSLDKDYWNGYIKSHDNKEVFCILEKDYEISRELTISRDLLTDEQNEMASIGCYVRYDFKTCKIQMMKMSDINWV